MKIFSVILLIVVSSSYGTQQKLHSGDIHGNSHQPHVRKIRQAQFQIQGVAVGNQYPQRQSVATGPAQSLPPTLPPPFIRGYGPARYYYPPRQYLPLRKCFYNPTGYVCCNEILNDLIVETFAELETRPKFHSCNIQAVANILQVRTEQKFNRTFETVVAYDDFAQKVHFSSDLICKVELGGRYVLAYATARNLQEYQLPPINNRPQQGPMTDAAHARIQTHTIRT